MEQGYLSQGSGSGSVRTPSTLESNKPKAKELPQREGAVAEVRILLDLRMSNGLHLRQGALSYGQLKRLVEKLEGLC